MISKQQFESNKIISDCNLFDETKETFTDKLKNYQTLA